MTDNKRGISGYIADYLAVNIAVDLLASSMNAKLDASKEENEELRARLAESDQLVEWLSRENAALKGDMAAILPELRELNEIVRKGTKDILEWTTWANAEIAKWWAKAGEVMGWAMEESAKLNAAVTENDKLRARVAFLEKALDSKPGMVRTSGGDGAFYRGRDDEAT